MGCRARDHNGPIKYQVINNDFAFVSRHKTRDSLAVNFHSVTEVHHATDFTLDLERTTTCVSQPRIFLCTHHQRNRAPTALSTTCSDILLDWTNEDRPTPNYEAMITELSLRSPRHFSVKSSTPSSASCTCISLTFNFPCCVLSVRIVSGMYRYQMWKPGIHSGSFVWFEPSLFLSPAHYHLCRCTYILFILICPSCFESAYFPSKVHVYYHLCKLEISILVIPCMIRTIDLSHRILEHYQLCYWDFGDELTNSSGIDVLSNYDIW